MAENDKTLADIESGLKAAETAMAILGTVVPGASFILAGLKLASAGVDAARGPTPEKLAAAKQAQAEAFALLDATT